MESKKFDKKKYDIEYNKKHYSQVKINLNKDLKNKFYEKLKKDNISVTEFFRKCIEKYLNIK